MLEQVMLLVAEVRSRLDRAAVSATASITAAAVAAAAVREASLQES